MIPSFENPNEYAEYLQKNGVDARVDFWGAAIHEPDRIGVWVGKSFFGFDELNKPINEDARDRFDFESILANRGK